MDARRRVIELIGSIANEDELAEKLIELVAKKLFLLGAVFEGQQTLFHLLVTHNKPKTLDTLLQINEWHAAATLTDSNQQTILHLAAQNKHISHEMPKLILKYLPALLNLQDAQQNTALHVSVINHITWFVMELTKNTELDRTLRNVDGKSALDLAGDNKDLKHAVCFLDLSAIRSVSIRHRANSHGVTDLSATFPLLSSRRDTPSSSSSGSSASTPSLEDGIAETEAFDDVKVMRSRVLTQSLRNLATLFPLGKLSPQFQQAMGDFLVVCNAAKLPDDFDFSEMKRETPQIGDVLSSVVDHFIPSFDSEINKLRLMLDNGLKQLIYTLTINGLTLPPDPSPLSCSYIHSDLKMLWQLTACQDSPETKREFSLEKLKCQSLGLLTQMSVNDVVGHLKLLYPRFDRHQKLVANYVLAQLLLFESVTRGDQESTTAQQLFFFKKFNVHRVQGLGETGVEINQHLKTVSDASAAFSRHPFLRNVRLLQSAILDEKKGGLSFEQLVRSAVASQRQDRIIEVYAIARALRTLTIEFYQNVSIKEFSEKNSFHIKKFKDASEKIRHFFIQLILEQTPSNMKNAFELLIDVIRALCPLSGENFPDLHHTMILYTVFVNSSILRLTTVFDSLSESDKNILAEIKQMTASDNNYKFMRDIHLIDSTSLPYLINLLNDFYMADQQEMGTLQKMSAFGSVLLNLFEVKFVVNFMMIKHSTDLPYFLNRYQLPDDKGLEAETTEHGRPRSVSQSSRLKSLSRPSEFFDRSKIPRLSIGKATDNNTPAPKKD